jgi:hypothetical protein
MIIFAKKWDETIRQSSTDSIPHSPSTTRVEVP